MAVAIRHDGFARYELMREKCDGRQYCAWCGTRARWNYWTVPDDSMTPSHHRPNNPPAFCGIDCYRTYNA